MGTWKILIADPIAPEGVELLKKGAEVEVRTGLAPAHRAGCGQTITK